MKKILGIVLGAIVLALLGMLGTLTIVKSQQVTELNAQLLKAVKLIKGLQAEVGRLKLETEDLEHKIQAAANGGHWEYEGAMGPENWDKVSKVCGSGKSQAPLDIKGPYAKAQYPLEPHYKPGVLRILNNGHTIQVNVPPGSNLKIGPETYELVQFHFHRPGEELFEGKPVAMVAHLVHKNSKGGLAVLGIPLRESAVKNRAIWGIWGHMPKKEGPEVTVSSVSIDPTALLPESLGYFSYTGSLTTPPCTEGVRFYILKTPSGIAKDQINQFPFKLNARPVQPLNGRTISSF